MRAVSSATARERAPTHARSRSFQVQMSRPPTRNGAHKQFYMLPTIPVDSNRSTNLDMSSHTGTYPTTEHHFTTPTSTTKEAKAVVCSGACATVSTVCGLRPIQLHLELLRTGQGSAKPSSCGRLRLLKVQSRSHLPVIRMCDSRAPVWQASMICTVGHLLAQHRSGEAPVLHAAGCA